jgi:hypothetical protein
MGLSTKDTSSVVDCVVQGVYVNVQANYVYII